MRAYSEASKAVFEVFEDATPLVEGLSIDEAFLDVRGLQWIAGQPTKIAVRLRSDVLERVGLPITIGIARTKFLRDGVGSSLFLAGGFPARGRKVGGRGDSEGGKPKVSPLGEYGGGGNRTRVRGRTEQNVYERSSRLISPAGRFANHQLTGQPS